MIAACPKCAARYRIEREKIGEGGVRLRCSRCESVFRVRAPAAPAASKATSPTAVSEPTRRSAAPPPSPVSGPAAAPQPSPGAGPAAKPQPSPGAGPAAEPQPSPGAGPAAAPRPRLETSPSPPKGPAGGEPAREVVVLLAMPDAGLAKTIADHLSEAGVPSEAVFDGVDAMLEIQRKQPKAVILAADLPKMFGFQVCEVVKRNASLRDTRVVLAGAVHHPDRYRRSPSELYGADAYVEVPDLPEGVLPILRGFGLLPAVAEAPVSETRSASFEETRIDDPPSDAVADRPRGAEASPGKGVRRSAGGLPPRGPDPFHQALGRDEPSHEPAPPPLEDESSPSLELDLDWAGSEAAQPPSARRPEPRPVAAPRDPERAPVAAPRDPEPRPVAAAPAPTAAPRGREPGAEQASGDGVPISLDFDFGEEELDPPSAAPAPAAPARPQAPPPPSPELAEQRAQAERLARIIVSDIVLYNEEKFAAAVEAGTVATVLSAELDEGRGLFTQRIDERVRREADFLLDELLRVARSRGMK